MASLTDKVAVVTGAAAGIGQAAAILMAEAGAKRIYGLDIAAAGLEATGEMIQAAVPATYWKSIVCDVSVSKQVNSTVEMIIADAGRIDTLANVAGIVNVVPVKDMTDEEWERVIHVNLFGTFYTNRAVVRHMIGQGSGTIVNVASARAFYGLENAAHYAASKAGIVSFTYSLAKEVGRHGIRVNTVIPGATDSPRHRQTWGTTEEQARANPNLARPENVARLILFLSSEESALLNGQNVGRVRSSSP